MIGAQLIRFVFVGAVVNVALYAMYLLLSWRTLGSEAAMTVTFCLGVLLSFLANRKLTFQHHGRHVGPLLRFGLCYTVMYIANFAILWFFALRLGFPHQLVQACAMAVLAVASFVSQKYWVFRATALQVAPLIARTG